MPLKPARHPRRRPPRAHNVQKLFVDRVGLEPWSHGVAEGVKSPQAPRGIGGAVEPPHGDRIGKKAINLLGAEPSDEAVVGHHKTIARGGRDPIRKLRIGGPVSAPARRLSSHARVKATNTVDDLIRGGPGAKDSDLRRHGRALAPAQGILGKDRVIPNAAANARIGELKQYGTNAAQRQGHGILVDTPLHGVGAGVGRLPRRAQKVDIPSHVAFHHRTPFSPCGEARRIASA